MFEYRLSLTSSPSVILSKSDMAKKTSLKNTPPHHPSTHINFFLSSLGYLEFEFSKLLKPSRKLEGKVNLQYVLKSGHKHLKLVVDHLRCKNELLKCNTGRKPGCTWRTFCWSAQKIKLHILSWFYPFLTEKKTRRKLGIWVKSSSHILEICGLQGLCRWIDLRPYRNVHFIR